jgi:hypothetical protein
MLPSVTHVVAIFELATGAQLRNHGSDGNAALISILTGIGVEIDLANPPVRRDDAGADLEFVSVGIRPPHDPLEIAMQAGECPLIGDQHATPDERRYVAQLDAQSGGLWSRGSRQVSDTPRQRTE